MALFNSDFEALIYVSIIFLLIYGSNKAITLALNKIDKLTTEQRVKASFIARLISIFFLVYLLLESFPSFGQLDPTYSAILAGSISTALAFASSELFVNLMSGLLLFIIDPFDIGHVIKVNNQKGIVRSITLTRVVMETFDGIIVELYNNDIVSSKIVNYSIDIENIKRYRQFKHKILAPQDRGKARLNLSFDDTYRDDDPEIRALFEIVKKEERTFIHNYTFRMQVPYRGFRIKVDKIDRLCEKYRETFGLKPQFHIIDFASDISLKFRILTLESQKLLDFQPDFAKDLYKIINLKELKTS